LPVRSNSSVETIFIHPWCQNHESGTLAVRTVSYQFSPNGRITDSKDQAERGCWEIR
jgi:hypothetical protein